MTVTQDYVVTYAESQKRPKLLKKPVPH